MSSTWYVYIVRCSDDTLYTGITTDVGRRVAEHNVDDRLAARYTRARRPVIVAYAEPAADRAAAARRGAAIKPMNRREKTALLQRYPLLPAE